MTDNENCNNQSTSNGNGRPKRRNPSRNVNANVTNMSPMGLMAANVTAALQQQARQTSADLVRCMIDRSLSSNDERIILVQPTHLDRRIASEVNKFVAQAAEGAAQDNQPIEPVNPTVEAVIAVVEPVIPAVEQVNIGVEAINPGVEQVNRQGTEQEVPPGGQEQNNSTASGEVEMIDRLFEIDPALIPAEPIEGRPQSRRIIIRQTLCVPTGNLANQIQRAYGTNALPSIQDREAGLLINSGTQPHLNLAEPNAINGDLFSQPIPIIGHREEDENISNFPMNVQYAKLLRAAYKEYNNVLSPTLKRARTTDDVPDEPPGNVKEEETAATTNETKIDEKSENDDKIFSQCSICLDQWEIEGKHRTISLACGHLFGYSCIQQWFQSNKSTCPTCNQHARIEDIRYIYAKAIGATASQAIAEENLNLKASFRKLDKYLKRVLTTSAMFRMENLRMKKSIISLKESKQKLEAASVNCTCGAVIATPLNDTDDAVASTSADAATSPSTSTDHVSAAINGRAGGQQQQQIKQIIKLSLEKNIILGNLASARCITYSKFTKCMYLTTKYNNTLFPGYGIHVYNIRNINTASALTSAKFVYVSKKPITDICLNQTGDHLIIACKEMGAKIMNLQSHSVSSIVMQTSDVTQITWSVAYDIVHPGTFILGLQNGTIVISNKKTITDASYFKHVCGNDKSPVISICPLTSTDSIPYGGILLCTFQSIWFLKHSANARSIDNFINVQHPSGPYVSLKYDPQFKVAFTIARPSSTSNCTRYIFSLVDFRDIDAGIVKCVNPRIINGSKTHQIKSLGTSFLNNNNLYTVNFMEDERCIAIWNVLTNERVQIYHVDDFIFDICSFEKDKDRYVCALSETKCRVFKVQIII